LKKGDPEQDLFYAKLHVYKAEAVIPAKRLTRIPHDSLPLAADSSFASLKYFGVTVCRFLLS
jgi:hypothetical protein